MAKKQKMSKKTKKRLTILTPIVILAVGYLLFTIVTTGIEIYELKVEEAQLEEELDNLESESDDLKTEITKLQDEDYIARYARENYLYTKDGEYVIKVTDEEEEEEEEKTTIPSDYIIYGSLALGVLIILYIIRKHRKRKKRKGGD